MLWLEGVPDEDREIPLHCRGDRTRVNDLRPEVGQLDRLFVGKRVEGYGFRDEPGICAHHAIHISPDMNFLAVEESAEDRCAEVAAIATEGGCQSLLRRCDKSRDDESPGKTATLRCPGFGACTRLGPHD